MSELKEYKCPCCGGAIEFNSSVQKMKCPYCDTEFEMETLLDYDKELNEESEGQIDFDTDHIETFSDEDDSIRSYICQSCGGEIVVDENTAATTCPFCDNPVVMKGNLKGQLKPEFVIPFKYDKKAAMEGFKGHMEGKKFLPKVFKSENHLEDIKGIYAPYWLFSSTVDARIRYKATTVRHYSDSRYDYTETSYYSVVRGGDISFDKVPVDGSKRLADDLMESAEPYDFSEAKPFQSAYLAGYVADRYDVEENDCLVRAKERVKQSTEDMFRNTVKGYTSVVPEHSNINTKQGKANYVMYPIWLLTTKWNNEDYIFAMNGQTGKFVGNLPADKGLMRKAFIKMFAIVFAILFAISTLFSFAADVDAASPRVIDNADLLDEYEEAELLTTLNEISERQMVDVVVVTDNDPDIYSAQDAADDYEDYNGFAEPPYIGAVLFYINIETRDWAFSGKGEDVMQYFTNETFEEMGEDLTPYLSDGEFYDAFDSYAFQCDYLLSDMNDWLSMTDEERQAYLDEIESQQRRQRVMDMFGSNIVFSLFGALIVALIYVFYHKKKLTSVAAAHGASNYYVEDSMHVTEAKDVFLYKNVTKVRRQESSSSGSSGGSHISSSGSSHTGASGKF